MITFLITPLQPGEKKGSLFPNSPWPGKGSGCISFNLRVYIKWEQSKSLLKRQDCLQHKGLYICLSFELKFRFQDFPCHLSRPGCIFLFLIQNKSTSSACPGHNSRLFLSFSSVQVQDWFSYSWSPTWRSPKSSFFCCDSLLDRAEFHRKGCNRRQWVDLGKCLGTWKLVSWEFWLTFHPESQMSGKGPMTSRRYLLRRWQRGTAP